MTRDQRPIGVTGATGRLGGRVARLLAAAGTTQRLLVRDPDRAPQVPGADVVRADYADTPSTRQALTGLSALFLVSASETPDRVDRHRAMIDAAVAAGVPHLVYVSFAGAAPDATFLLARDHWHTEAHLRAGGPPWTFLRDNLYADFLPGLAGPDPDGPGDVIRGPAGDGRVAAVTQDDIAGAAVAVLQYPDGHVGQTYELTGPRALTFTEIAAVLTAHTGRPVRFHDETLADAFASRAGSGAPDWMIAGWVSTYTAVAAGELAAVTDDVQRLTGRPATDITKLFPPR